MFKKYGCQLGGSDLIPSVSYTCHCWSQEGRCHNCSTAAEKFSQGTFEPQIGKFTMLNDDLFCTYPTNLYLLQQIIIYGLLMFTGNGYIGVEASPSSQLYIKSGRTLSFPVQFYPVVEINLEGYHMSGISSSINDNYVQHCLRTQ